MRELWVRGDLYRRRPDLIGFVNGLPLLFIECKNMHRDLKAAFEANYSDYRDTVPHLFHHNAVVMFANGEQAKIGSITSRWEHFHEWKRLAEEEPGAVAMETLLKGVCDRRNFIDLVENFILFDDSSGALRKIVARNHQFLGVNRAVQAVRERRSRQGRLGVFWHTQGAGKSYSMVMFTRKVRRKLGGNFTFLVFTDRDDLDRQIYRTFAGCGVVDHDREPCRAASGAHLSRLLPSARRTSSRSSRSSTRTPRRAPAIPGATISSSSPTRRTAPSTATLRSTCAAPCPTRATSALPGRRCLPTTSSPGGYSATTCPPMTFSAPWRTAPRCRSTTPRAATSWA